MALMRAEYTEMSIDETVGEGERAWQGRRKVIVAIKRLEGSCRG